MQHTLKSTVYFEGIGLHTGQTVKMTIHPAQSGGIIFNRTDLPNEPVIPARYNYVIDTTMSTRIGTSTQNLVSTIEHLMAALFMCQIDHALIDIDAPEVPLGDGASALFVEAILKGGLKELETKSSVLKVLKKVEFKNEKAHVVLTPSDQFIIENKIVYDNTIIGTQSHREIIDQNQARKTIANARTFGHRNDYEKLKKMGLARGASLENLLAFNDEEILSPEKLRYPNEFARHKVLDTIGDLYTAGLPIQGEYVSDKGGHYHNNMILRKLFADSSNFAIK